MITKTQLAALILETIYEGKESGAISGHMYAALMGHTDLDTFQSILATLTKAGLVRHSGHVYYYTGPPL